MPTNPSVAATTTTMASGRGSQRPTNATSGCSNAAIASAATSQPTTRVDAASSRRPARVTPSIAMATSTDRVEKRTRSVGVG